MPLDDTHRNQTPLSLFLVFLRLGLTAFGGPIAHLAYFREEFVLRRRWLSDSAYADLVALCQILPGPASSQVGIALGLSQAGLRGAVAAWLGFTLPSAIALILFALSLEQALDTLNSPLLRTLEAIAVAVVAQAVWGMGRQLCRDQAHLSIMAASCAGALLIPTAWTQLFIIGLAALAGTLWLKPSPTNPNGTLHIHLSGHLARRALLIFFGLLLVLPLLAWLWPTPWITHFDAFYRAGALVFGGGHVVLPLLQSATVASGWVDPSLFLAGYTAAQAVPGPLFTFAAFLGASMQVGPTGWLGGLLAVLAIFLPAFLLVLGTLPIWQRLPRQGRALGALSGINAAVVGLLLAALYDPIWTSAIRSRGDFIIALLAFLALLFWRLPAWAIVLLGSGGAILYRLCA